MLNDGANTQLKTVTVVLATHRYSDELLGTLRSIQAQTYTDFDVIVVGDGDPSKVAECVAFLNDTRLQYMPNPRGGLTAALIKGCARAQGDVIARIDMGDRMSPERLAEQMALFNANHRIGLVCSRFETYTQEGSFLFATIFDSDQLAKHIKSNDIDMFAAPAHASCSFRKDIYQAVGGYRREFYFAQDCDLWTRISEFAEIDYCDIALTTGLFSVGGISAQFAREQRQFLQYALAARQARQNGESEQGILERCLRLSNDVQSKSEQSQVARIASAQYFIGKCLMQNNDDSAKQYFKAVIKQQPLNAKAWFFYLLVLYRSISS